MGLYSSYRGRRGGHPLAVPQYIKDHLKSIISLPPDCNCIVTRGGVYDEISPEPEGNPEGGARGISRGLRRYFIVYPDSSHNTVILNHLY